MKDDSSNPSNDRDPVDPMRESSLNEQLEARLVALALGEASDFEQEELRRLIAESPEVAAFYEEVQVVSGLLKGVGTGEFPSIAKTEPNEGWKLSPKRREKVLQTFSGNTFPVATASFKEQDQGVRWPKRIVWRSKMLWGIVASAALVLIAFGSSLWVTSNRFARTAQSTAKLQRHLEDNMALAVEGEAYGFNRWGTQTSESSDGASQELIETPFLNGTPASSSASQTHDDDGDGAQQLYFGDMEKVGRDFGLRENEPQTGPSSGVDRFESKTDFYDFVEGAEITSKFQKLGSENSVQGGQGDNSFADRPGAMGGGMMGGYGGGQVANGQVAANDKADGDVAGDSVGAGYGGAGYGGGFGGRGYYYKENLSVQDLETPDASIERFDINVNGRELATTTNSVASSSTDQPVQLWEETKSSQGQSQRGQSQQGLPMPGLRVKGSQQSSAFDIANSPMQLGDDKSAAVEQSGNSEGWFANSNGVQELGRDDRELGEVPPASYGFRLQTTDELDEASVDSHSLSNKDEQSVVRLRQFKQSELQSESQLARSKVRLQEAVQSFGASHPQVKSIREEILIAEQAKSASNTKLSLGKFSKEFPVLENAENESAFEEAERLSGVTRFWSVRGGIANEVRPVAINLQEKDAASESFSAFSLHVGDVSFKLAQAALAKGEWPDASKTRIEEFVNAFDYGDPLPTEDEKVSCTLEQSIHPFLQQRNLLRVSMRTAATGRSNKTPLRLTFLLDNSGSMERPDRRQTVQRAFATLAQQLNPLDQVTLNSFAREPRLLADQINGAKANDLVNIVQELPSEGGTNIEAALKVGFEKAREQQLAGAQNRIILLTDGAVNLGNANPESLSQWVATMREAGIAFDAAGISAEGLNDEVLEALTRQGDGRYYLLDSAESVDDGFARQIAGALRPSAKNVKVQVEFNPRRVGKYKLLGFEKHRLNKEDFRNDKVDAAEMAAEEAGVAVYQFEAKPDGEGDVGLVSVRFQDMSTGEMVEQSWPIPYDPATPRVEQASPSLQIATSAAMLAAKFGNDPLGDVVQLDKLARLVASLPAEAKRSGRVRQLEQMIQQARDIAGD